MNERRPGAMRGHGPVRRPWAGLRTRWAWAVLAVVSAWPLAAPAQQQTCKGDVNGRTVDLPCQASGGGYRTYGSNAADYNRFLSPRCASLNDAMATAGRMGNYNTYQDLQREFSAKCMNEAQDAIRRMRGERDAMQQSGQAQRQAADREQQDARALGQRCDGMRDVIALKRKREATLNETEVAALRQLEVTYNETCLRR